MYILILLALKRFDFNSDITITIYNEYNKLYNKYNGTVYAKDIVKNKILMENISGNELLISYFDNIPITFSDLLLYDSFHVYLLYLCRNIKIELLNKNHLLIQQNKSKYLKIMLKLKIKMYY